MKVIFIKNCVFITYLSNLMWQKKHISQEPIFLKNWNSIKKYMFTYT